MKRLFKGLKLHVLLLIVLSSLYSYLNLQIVVYISYAIDGILFHHTQNLPNYCKQAIEEDVLKGLVIISIVIVGMNLLIVFVNYIRERITTRCSLKISSNLKKTLYDHILKLEYESYQSYDKVEMLQRVNEDAQEYSDFFKSEINFVKLILFYEIVSEHLTYLSDPIICLLGGISIIHGNMTLGELTALLLFAKKVLMTCYSFGENLEVVDNFFVIQKKIKRLMCLREEKNEKEEYDLNGDIRFHNVSIHISKKEILSDLNFVIKKGEKVAIVGENGSGKSILAKAILGYYPVQGNIYLNYHNHKRLNKANLRKYVDFISGEVDLFTGSILENIELDKKSTKEELTKVVKEAEIDKEIEQFDGGFQTKIGEKGIKLSGGQKQRILIARALLRNKSIMIFDGIFSKLDKETTNKIFQNLIKEYPQTTMIFMTHNLEIQNGVNKIIKLDNRKKAGKRNEMER